MLFDVLGIVISALVLFFVISVFFQKEVLPRTLLPELKRNLRTVKERERGEEDQGRKLASQNQGAPI